MNCRRCTYLGAYEGSYASNEIAINWSAALVALVSSLDALMSK